MLATLLHKLGNLLRSAERHRTEDYLMQSSDLAELERRQRWIDRNDY